MMAPTKVPRAHPPSPHCVSEYPSTASVTHHYDEQEEEEEVVEMVKPAMISTRTGSTGSSSSSSSSTNLVTADDWYVKGERVSYDPVSKRIVPDGDDQADTESTPSSSSNNNNVSLPRAFYRVVVPQQQQSEEEEGQSQAQDDDQQEEEASQPLHPQSQQRWMTFLPSHPEGSYGFHQIEQALGEGQGGIIVSGDTADTSSKSSSKRGRCDTDSTEMSLEESIAHNSNNAEEEDVEATVEGAYRQHEEEAEGHEESEGQGDGDCHDSQEDEDEMMTNSSELSRLYLDYLGQGDSDATTATTAAVSPTKQRADLVEAHWKHHGIIRTVVVSAGDASSLVVMELLQRQRARLAAGSPFPKILHILSLNGRYVAKTKHASQLPAVTQVLRSDRWGPALAAKAQRSDFVLNQCLQPYFKGLNHVVSKQQQHHHHHQQEQRHVRQQVMEVVRRHHNANTTTTNNTTTTTALRDMAKTVDDHLTPESHKYRWDLPRLMHAFGQNQGITVTLATTNRAAWKHSMHVQHACLHEYDLSPEDFPGIRYQDWTTGTNDNTAASTTTAFLLGSSREQLQPLLRSMHRLANEEIPLSDNSPHHGDSHPDANQMIASLRRLMTMATMENDDLVLPPHDDDDDGDSWHMQLSESDLAQLILSEQQPDEDHQSQDSRLETEIMFDAADNGDDDLFLGGGAWDDIVPAP